MKDVEKHNKPRLIQGLILKCVDGRWIDGDGLTPAGQMLAVNTSRGLQCWGDKELLDEIVEMPGEPLPDVDELNAQIPQEEWRPGLDGKPRPPWSLNYVAYLLNLESGQRYTFINNTTGARLAVERLEDRMLCIRALRGPNVRPIIKLDSRVMKTSFGQKQRPEFTITEWRDFGGEGGAALLGPHGGGGGSAPQIEYKPKIGPDVIKRVEPAPAATAPEKQKKKVGKPVTPPSVSEEIDDGLPFDLAPPI
jgi:hypothetical protein